MRCKERATPAIWVIDTMMGNEHGRNSVITLVELATGCLAMGKLARHCLPKPTSVAHVTQDHCDAIAAKLNSRPRKRLSYRTPEECHARA